MRFSLFVILFLSAVTYPVNAGSDQLLEFNQVRQDINRTGMLTLGAWAGGNILLNSVLYQNAQGNRRYFYQMNVFWNLVNLGIAGIGYYQNLGTVDHLNLIQSLHEQQNIEKILLFNAGLDIAYIMTGFFLIEKAKNSTDHKARLDGYGKSLILQGGFLFVFDLVLYFIHIQHADKLHSLISDLPLSIRPDGIIFRFTF